MTVVRGYVPTGEGQADLDRAIEEAQLRAVGQLVMGSQAQRILLVATCPVLAVKARAKDH